MQCIKGFFTVKMLIRVYPTSAIGMKHLMLFLRLVMPWKNVAGINAFYCLVRHIFHITLIKLKSTENRAFQ